MSDRSETIARVALADQLTGDTNLRADGTIWSHAATLGSFVHGGSPFTIDAETLKTIVANFTAGYPAKVPIDYEHETQLDQAQRGSAPTMRAGQIAEVRAVLTPDDLLPEMKQQLDAERARRQRIGLSREVDPLGLWVRWEPTARALKMVKDKEVTEMSVVIHFDYPHKNTGEGQGPTLLSVALTNTPFLDDMIPVAATRSHGGTRDAPAKPLDEETTTMTATPLMLAVAAHSGKAANDEATAVQNLNDTVVQLRADAEVGRKSRESLALLTAEIGVSDPTGAVLKVREFKATAASAEAESKKTRLTAIAGAVKGFLDKNEKRLSSVPMRKHFEDQITAEMLKDASLEVEKTLAAQVVLSMSETKSLGRTTPTDNGQNVNDDQDVLIANRANELLTADAEIKEIVAKSGRTAGLRLAIVKAAREAGITDVAAPRPVKA